MISWRRMAALIRQEWFISKRSLEVIMDLPFFSMIDIVLFGFVSFYVLDTADATIGQNLLLGAILWEIVRVTQYSMTVSSMWNVWSRNLSNMLIAPISLAEYVLASAIAAVLKSAAITCGLAVLAAWLFDFHLLAMGFGALLWYGLNLALFSGSIGLILLGLVFRFGTRIQALGWAMIFLFQPLSATFFPVEILPRSLQLVAYALPPTYFFEGARASLATGTVAWSTQVWPVLLNFGFVALGVFLFNHFYQRARVTGQMARLEN